MAPGVEILSSVPMGTAKVSKVFAVNMGDKANVDLEIPSRAFFDSAAVDKEIQLPIADFGLGVISGQNLQGQIALIDRGQNSFEDKVKNAVRLGAKAVLIVNDEPGLFEGSVSSDENSTKLSPVPVFMIEKTSGQMLRQSLQKGQSVQVRLQSFVSDYDLYSGTSMATPHVTGMVALLLSAKPDLSPGQARDVLSKSCEPIPGENTHRVGNGLLQADKALGKVLEIR
jgi:subtilisin family serine protease